VLSFSIETFNTGTGKTMATIYSPIFASKISPPAFMRPFEVADTKDGAIYRLRIALVGATGVDIDKQILINIRHYDLYACVMCRSMPKFEEYGDYMEHLTNHFRAREASLRRRR